MNIGFDHLKLMSGFGACTPVTHFPKIRTLSVLHSCEGNEDRSAKRTGLRMGRNLKTKHGQRQGAK